MVIQGTSLSVSGVPQIAILHNRSLIKEEQTLWGRVDLEMLHQLQ
jgi:hypothetical protein